MNYRNSDRFGSLATSTDKGLRKKGVADFRSGQFECIYPPQKVQDKRPEKKAKIIERGNKLLIVEK